MKNAKAIKRSIVVAQLGVSGYRLERATNFLDIPVGKTLTRVEVEHLISENISVTIQRNR